MTTYPHYTHLEATEHLFADGFRSTSALAGLKAHGPLAQGDCPAKPRVLFVFAEEFKDHANRLFLALKNGIGPFRGVEQWFRFSLATDRVLRVKSFSVAGLPTKDAASRYAEAIEEFLESGERVDLAFVLHPKTDIEDAHSPYYYSKFPLLSANIPAQSVTTELLDTRDLFQWSAGNIALQAFSKMGGIPWAIATGMSEDSLIVGINRATIVDRGTGEVARWWGFATVFSTTGSIRAQPCFHPPKRVLNTLRHSGKLSPRVWQAGGGTSGHQRTSLFTSRRRSARMKLT